MSVDFAASSSLTQIFAAFNAGLLTSLTPCIYPLIPITLAIFGAQNESSRTRSFLLALSYVLGIAATYTVLGIISAKTGALFGSFLAKPAVVLALSAFLFALALYSLDALKFSAIGKVQQAASHIGGKGFRGAFLMGTVSGFVAAPCAGPILVVILGVAAAQKNTAWAAVLLFTYSMGMGLLFLVLGLFPGFLRRLPKSGNWLHAVKFLTAVLLITVVLFISQPYHESTAGSALRPLPILLWLFVIVGCLLAWVSYARQIVIARVSAAIVVGLPLFYMVVPAPSASSVNTGAQKLNWETTLESALSTAAKNNTIAMVDLFADWCAACKELDHITFSDSKVQERLSSIALARLDFTSESAYNDELVARYSVLGLPCVMFLKPNGEEIPNTRITGFVPPEEFLRVFESASNQQTP